MQRKVVEVKKEKSSKRQSMDIVQYEDTEIFTYVGIVSGSTVRCL